MNVQYNEIEYPPDLQKQSIVMALDTGSPVVSVAVGVDCDRDRAVIDRCRGARIKDECTTRTRRYEQVWIGEFAVLGFERNRNPVVPDRD